MKRSSLMVTSLHRKKRGKSDNDFLLFSNKKKHYKRTEACLLIKILSMFNKDDSFESKKRSNEEKTIILWKAFQCYGIQ